MAEILVRVRDKEAHPDPYIDVQRSKRGDVIAVCPDGWQWSSEERTNPDWRIIVVVGLEPTVASRLLEAEQGGPKVNKMRRRRGYKLDVDFASLPQAGKNYLRDDTRAQPSIAISNAMAASLLLQKTPLQDPAVIG